MRQIAVIGDIHAQADPLLRLLARLDGEVETLVFLGDYVNRGAFAAQVLDVLTDVATRKQCVFLEGNHDAAFRQALRGDFDPFLALGGAATVRSYISPPYVDVEQEFLSAVPAEHRAFLEQLLPRYETPELLVEHALPEADGTGRYRVGGHAPQLGSAPSFGHDYAYVDTGCGTVTGGMLTALFWPGLTWESVPC